MKIYIYRTSGMPVYSNTLKINQISYGYEIEINSLNDILLLPTLFNENIIINRYARDDRYDYSIEIYDSWRE